MVLGRLGIGFTLDFDRDGVIRGVTARRPEDGESRKKAVNKAKAMLLSKLSPEQRGTYLSDNYFLVKGSRGNTYRITTGGSISGNVAWVILPEPGDYRPIRDTFGPKKPVLTVGGSYCAYPSAYNLPAEDQYLGQMLHLVTAEDDWLNTAYIQTGNWPPTFKRKAQAPEPLRVRFAGLGDAVCPCPFCEQGRELLGRVPPRPF